MANSFELVVVGAGWYGLASAKVYLQLHPAARILVLDAGESCGGTWSAARLYPGLKSNNLLGTYEYPDFPLSSDVYSVKPGEHIPGHVLNRYLTDYATTFNVLPHIRFGHTVTDLGPRLPHGWTIKATTNQEEEIVIESEKVILATGLTSQPNFPSYAEAETFQAPLFHAKDFCRNAETVQASQNAVVVGGAKSAFDVAYAYADAGVQVDLVIRPNGNGPVWISYPWVMGGKKRLEQLLTVRWMTWFSPCPFGGVDGWQWVRDLLHGTTVGRFLVDKFWGGLEGEVIELNGYKNHPEVRKLQPWNSAFWIGSGLSIHNYDHDFFQMVKTGKIRIHIAEVERLSEKTVHLSTGDELPADVLVCATGWLKESNIAFDKKNIAGLELPNTFGNEAQLATAADDKLLTMYPRLRNQPVLNTKPKGSPYRLYRFIVPPAYLQDRSIAFAGMVSSVTTATSASIQALWIAAYLNGKLAHAPPGASSITQELMLHTQWGKWRYPCGYGAVLPDLVFDSLPYTDLLMKDLGLSVYRKDGGWLANITQPHMPSDYAGVVDEWRRNRE